MEDLQNNNVKVSLIIPVYNVEKYIGEMLKSIYNQTFCDFEVIIVNDGSTDKSEDIILKYCEKYNNITYLKQNNLGVSEARNLAMKEIKGKYSLFLDSDDYIECDMLEKLYVAIEKNNADIAICGFKKIYESNNKEEVILFNVENYKIYKNFEVINKMLNMEIRGFLWNKMFLTKNIFKYNMHFEKDRYIQDWAPVFNQVINAEKIVFVNEPLYYYRQRENSNLHRVDIKRIDDFNFAAKLICSYIEKSNINMNERSYYKFIAQVQCTEIKDCKKLNGTLNKSFYTKYLICNKSTKDILFKINASLKDKIKLILYNIKILHLFYN